MAVYDYYCEACNRKVEIIRSMKDDPKPEYCDECGGQLQRIYSCQIHISGSRVTDAEYYVPFDKVIKNKRERQYEIEKRGLIEIGNEKPERARYYMERARKEKLAKDYED